MLKCYITDNIEVAFNTAQSVMTNFLFEMLTNLHQSDTFIFITKEYLISAAR